MKIAEQKVVSIHYELRNTQGEVLDSSLEQDPLTYLHGLGNLIEGPENALEGLVPGDVLAVDIPPEEAYGVVDTDLIQVVPRIAFEGIDRIEPGMQFETSEADGQPQSVTLVSVDQDSVTIDANHPLAGQILHFDVTVEAVRSATQEELDHGHAH